MQTQTEIAAASLTARMGQRLVSLEEREGLKDVLHRQDVEKKERNEAKSKPLLAVLSAYRLFLFNQSLALEPDYQGQS